MARAASAGAALDVLADETEPNQALIAHPRCIVTPHCAYSTQEAYDTVRLMSLQAVIDKLIFDRKPQHTVA